MKGRSKLWPAPLLALMVLVLYPAWAGADSKYIQTDGTSSGSGKRTITVEPVSLATGGTRVSRAMTTFVVDVTIPVSSSASNTTILIRDSLDIALPAEYVVTIPQSNIVQILRTLGSFDMFLTGTVPGQTIEEVPLPPHTYGLPVVGKGWRPILLALVLLFTGLVFLGRRGRRGRREAARIP